MRRCNPSARTFQQLKINGQYPCQICPETCTSIYQLMQHVYRHHCEVQVHRVHAKSVEAFIGEKVMIQLRNVTLNAIIRQGFDQYIFDLLGHEPGAAKEQFPNLRKPDFQYDQQYRHIFESHYDKRREMLLKLAREVPGTEQLGIDDYQRLTLSGGKAQYLFDLKRYMSSAVLVDCLTRAIRQTTLARKNSWVNVPWITKLCKTGSEVFLEAEYTGQPLRELFRDRAFVKSHALDIVVAFSEAFTLFRAQDITLRTIQPSTVAYDPDAKKLTFADQRFVCKSGIEVDRQNETSFPYRSSGIPPFFAYRDTHPMRDNWCLGVIILEMLVGPELVLTLRSYAKFLDLFEKVSKHLDQATLTLLEHLFDIYHVTSLDEYVRNELGDNPELLTQDMRAMDAAIPDDYELNKLREQARATAQKEKEEMKENFGFLVV